MVELRATGMPLGLLPGMTYEEKEALLEPGESIILYSDGLVEAHDPEGEMFGFPRLRELMGKHPGGVQLIQVLRQELANFTGPGWEQEDDVTFLTLERASLPVPSIHTEQEGNVSKKNQEQWHTLAEFSLPSEPGNERQAMEQVAAAVQELALPADQLERLKTAVAEASLNAMEHGNKFQRDLPAVILVQASQKALRVLISDQGGSQPIPDPVEPDLEAKLSGMQSPRGWGLFLIKKMVDEMNITVDDKHHTVELILNLKGGPYD